MRFVIASDPARGKPSANSVKVSFAYDNLSAIKSVSYADGTAAVNYTYNKNGDLTQLTAGQSTQSYVYNPQRQLTEESLNYKGRVGTEHEARSVMF